VANAAIDHANSSNLSPQQRFWKGIWQLHTSNKIKHFIWRACNNSLPTMCNLSHRHITSSETCEQCNACSKDVVHTLWLCKEVKSAWSLFINLHQANFPLPHDFCELTNQFLQVHDDYRKEIFAISAWLLWNRRNALHFGRPLQPIANISAMAGNLL